MQVITLLKRKIAEHQLGARLAVAVAPGNLDVVRASQGAKPQLVATGHDALRWVGRHIGRTKLTVASSYGPVDLTPGTIWDGGKLLVLVDAQTVHYTVGRNLYRWNTSDFIRDEWLGALARAAHNARGMVTLVKVEVEFLTGLLVGPEIVLAVSAARIAWFAHRNYKLLGELWAHADQFTNAWRAFAALCPKTHALVDREMWRAGLDYWAHAEVHFHRSLARCLALLAPSPFVVEVGATRAPWDAPLCRGSVIVLGPEKGCVDDAVLEPARRDDRVLTLPMVAGRSLNLAQVAAAVVFEAVRQGRALRPGT